MVIWNLNDIPSSPRIKNTHMNKACKMYEVCVSWWGYITTLTMTYYESIAVNAGHNFLKSEFAVE